MWSVPSTALFPEAIKVEDKLAGKKTKRKLDGFRF